jgi:Restriction endonuclease
MAPRKQEIPDWKQFEQLVARIEEDAGPLGLAVTSPDKILCRITGRKREVDVSVRSRIGTVDVLITIECRKRRPRQDVTWIEHLAAKRDSIGASCTIAVSSSGFTASAEAVARRYGIKLRRLSEVSAAEINTLMRIAFVAFTHKRVALTRAALRFARPKSWSMPNGENVDMVLPKSTKLHSPLFCHAFHFGGADELL